MWGRAAVHGSSVVRYFPRLGLVKSSLNPKAKSMSYDNTFSLSVIDLKNCIRTNKEQVNTRLRGIDIQGFEHKASCLDAC